MPIEHHSGGTTITGESIDYFRLCSMKMAVGLECKGIKVHRGPVLWKRAAAEYGIRGNKHVVYAALCALIADLQTKQEHVSTVNGRVVREVNGQEIV